MYCQTHFKSLAIVYQQHRFSHYEIKSNFNRPVKLNSVAKTLFGFKVSFNFFFKSPQAYLYTFLLHEDKLNAVRASIKQNHKAMNTQVVNRLVLD
jgi:hypothetical protein